MIVNAIFGLPVYETYTCILIVLDTMARIYSLRGARVFYK